MIHTDEAKWIQYAGVEVENEAIYFKFKSSQNSIEFKFFVHTEIDGDFTLSLILNAHYMEIYEYFRNLKYETL